MARMRTRARVQRGACRGPTAPVAATALPVGTACAPAHVPQVSPHCGLIACIGPSGRSAPAECRGQQSRRSTAGARCIANRRQGAPGPTGTVARRETRVGRPSELRHRALLARPPRGRGATASRALPPCSDAERLVAIRVATRRTQHRPIWVIVGQTLAPCWPNLDQFFPKLVKLGQLLVFSDPSLKMFHSL